MTTAMTTIDLPSAIEQVLVGGDLSKLTTDQRVTYYNRVCDSLGLNPLTKPFNYLNLNGKLVLYATKDCTEQLRKRDGISVTIVGREAIDGVYIVTARAVTASGRADESIGAVSIDNLRGEARANAVMKAETKAKRRVTLSICGMGMLDESEVDSIPGAYPDPLPDLPTRRVPAVRDVTSTQEATLEPQPESNRRKMLLGRATAALRSPRASEMERDLDLDTLSDAQLDGLISEIRLRGEAGINDELFDD